ncbi:MAG: YbhB/YbcL family Raf kinase inhibitor-like protein [Candidatus Magasanikbacteria bacterium]|nr:YbhB/YbcL family Raf kinase inhibitor-like protein [Candidatus Magasanikbacteria bacterium]
MSWQLTSSAFQHNGVIPSRYTCDGKNISPPLAWSNVPPGTKSLALIMDDPDVPLQAKVPVWDHWIIFNIPVTVTRIEEGKNPEGILGINTNGKNAYGGPCPPDREHRYFFKLYALDSLLTLEAGVTKQEVKEAMKGHVLAKTELIGLYNHDPI